MRSDKSISSAAGYLIGALEPSKQANMTQPRHLLHPSSATQIAAAALSAQGEYGIITNLAVEHDVRRQRVYDLRERARRALKAEFSAAIPEQAGSFTLKVTPAEMERAVVALRVVTPASIRDIVEMLPVLFGKSWSYVRLSTTYPS